MNPSWFRLAAQSIKGASRSKHVPPPFKRSPRPPPPTEPLPPPLNPQPAADAAPKPPRFSSRTAQALRIAFWAPQLFIWLHLGVSWIGSIKATGGPSMLPLLPVSDSAVWISRRYRRGRDVRVGDVVSFAHPIGDYNAIKRVVGMPGDFVLRDTPDEGEGMMIQVPRGHCYLVGDNLPWSRDSRVLGPVPLGLIQGKVTATLWPLNRIGRVENGLVPVSIEEDTP